VDVGIYARLSEDRDGLQTATARQIADCRRLAEVEGDTVLRVYEDVDLSAWRKDVVRPDYEEALRDLEDGVIRGLYCWKLDRLVRDPREFERVLDVVERAGAKLRSVHEHVDTLTASGLFQARLGVNLARMESDNISLRTRRAMIERARNGAPHPGAFRPYGYSPDWGEVVPEEAEIIREAATRILAGDSLRSVTADLNRRGLRTTAGHEFRPANLRRILRNPRNAARRAHRGHIVADGTWPAILDRATWEQLCAVLAEGRPGRPRVSVLTGGLVRCGLCGEPLQAKRRRGVRRYVCMHAPGTSGCGRITILADPLEEVVRDAVLVALDNQRYTAAIKEQEAGGEQAQLAADLTADEAKLLELVDLYTDREISKAEYLRGREKLEARIRKAKARLRRPPKVLEGLPSGAEALRALWDDWDVDHRRQVLEAVLETVVVHPATVRARFDRDRVELRWRV
jgi:site-specific DNA recombinase